MNVYMACSCGVGTGRLIGDSKYSRVRVKVDAVTIKHTITQPPITSQAHGTNSISRGLSIAVHTETKNINMIQRVRPPTSSVILIQVSRSIQPAGKQGSTLSHRISSSPLINFHRCRAPITTFLRLSPNIRRYVPIVVASPAIKPEPTTIECKDISKKGNQQRSVLEPIPILCPLLFRSCACAVL